MYKPRNLKPVKLGAADRIKHEKTSRSGVVTPVAQWHLTWHGHRVDTTPSKTETPHSGRDGETPAVDSDLLNDDSSGSLLEIKEKLQQVMSASSELSGISSKWEELFELSEKEHRRQLDEFNDEMRQDYERQSAKLKEELREEQARIVEVCQTDDARQQEFNQMTVDYRRQLKLMQIDQKQVLDELHQEKIRCADVERTYTDMKAKFEDAQKIIDRLEKAKADSIRSLNCLHAHDVIGTKDLETDVQLLRQQISVYRADFNEEREDRERTRTEFNSLRSRFEQQTLQLIHIQDELRKNQEELSDTKSKNLDLNVRYKQVQDELWKMNGECRPRQPRSKGIASRLRATASHHATDETRPWYCKACTYGNLEARHACEMCGSMREVFSVPVYQPIDDFESQPVSPRNLSSPPLSPPTMHHQDNPTTPAPKNSNNLPASRNMTSPASRNTISPLAPNYLPPNHMDRRITAPGHAIHDLFYGVQHGVNSDPMRIMLPFDADNGDNGDIYESDPEAID